MNNVTLHPVASDPPEPQNAAGRPGLWANGAERQRAYRQRRQAQLQLLDELLAAARNAHWDEPELQRVVLDGDDVAVLQALSAHYRARHWMRRTRSESK